MCELLSQWPSSYQEKSLCRNIQALDNITQYNSLTESLYKYARENLALVNIYIKEPVVTKIVRDQRIPVIWFVANCGGILGLCMGFSIVTVFEVIHCLMKALMESINRWYYKVSFYRQPGKKMSPKLWSQRSAIWQRVGCLINSSGVLSIWFSLQHRRERDAVRYDAIFFNESHVVYTYVRLTGYLQT